MNDAMSMDMGRDLGLILPEIVLVLTGVIVLMVGMLRRHAGINLQFMPIL